MKKALAAIVLVAILLVRRLWARTQDGAPEQASIVAGKVATYSGAATAITAGLTITEWGVVIGAVVGVLGLIFGQYWARRREAREEAERVEMAEARARREAREAEAHAAYLRRLERDAHPSAPMPLSMCANDPADMERA